MKSLAFNFVEEVAAKAYPADARLIQADGLTLEQAYGLFSEVIKLQKAVDRFSRNCYRIKMQEEGEPSAR